jgi:hypothetical protein
VQYLIGQDGKKLHVSIQLEAYGLFTRYMSAARRVTYANLSRDLKETQGLVPDFVISNPSVGSPLAPPRGGEQMMELKRVHGVTSNGANGTSPSPYYGKRDNLDGTPRTGANMRQKEIPKGYSIKARVAGEKYCEQGQNRILEAFRNMPEVIGLVVGAFGELSSNFDKVIKGFAFEGATRCREIQSPERFIQAKGQIAWYLRRRWSRIAQISAVQTRHDAMAYVGDTPAKAQAATRHSAREAAQEEHWRFEPTRAQEEFRAGRYRI